jgi:3-oxoacyl-[acyl-carrier-protein] synthase III
MGKSNAPTSNDRIRFIKMHGRKIYEYSLNQVPGAMKEALEKSGVGVQEIKRYYCTRLMRKWMPLLFRGFISFWDEGQP